MALLCLGRSPGTGWDGTPFPGSKALTLRGSPAFRPVSWNGEAATHLHIEDGLWDRDGTSHFPPCLGAHRFEELFCFLDFFSPCFPPSPTLPSPPRGHRLLTRPLSPSDTSKTFPNSVPHMEAAGGGRASDRAGATSPRQSLLSSSPGKPRAQGPALERVRREGFAPFLGFARQNPNLIYYAGS